VDKSVQVNPHSFGLEASGENPSALTLRLIPFLHIINALRMTPHHVDLNTMRYA
jgi:hypothetical protein